MNKIISHELSKFGKVDIALHKESAIFYDLLEEKGIINYLKNLDHLGFISKSHPGNNHKRWDYVMLQLYILHKLKDEVFRTGLSSGHRIDGRHEVSGLVILQIAVFFSNIGHLKGTLSSEVGFLDFLERNNYAKSDFLSNISDSQDWMDFTNNIINNKDYYKIKYIIALNFFKEPQHKPSH